MVVGAAVPPGAVPLAGLGGNGGIGGDNGADNASGNFLGRSVKFLRDAAASFVVGVYDLAVKTLQVMSAIKKDGDAFAKLLRGAGYTLMGLKECGVDVLNKFGAKAADTVNLIDAVMLIGDIQYFASGQFKKDSLPQFIGRTALAIADLGGALMWLEELGFGLSKIATALGNTRFFSFVPLIPLGNIVTGFVGLGFAFMGIDAIWRLYQMKDTAEAEDPNVGCKRIKAILDLTWCGFEVVGKVVMIAAALSIIPVAPVGIIATLGVSAACFGLTSFIYGVLNKDRLDAPALQAADAALR